MQVATYTLTPTDSGDRSRTTLDRSEVGIHIRVSEVNTDDPMTLPRQQRRCRRADTRGRAGDGEDSMGLPGTSGRLRLAHPAAKLEHVPL